jgi:hypothetical protein
MALIDIKVPDIGDFKDVAVIELLVKPGDTIKSEQSLVTVESDKASMEIPSSHAGVVKSLNAGGGGQCCRGRRLGSSAQGRTCCRFCCRAGPGSGQLRRRCRCGM